MSPTFTHRTADFIGVAPALLRDSGFIGGLLVAGAGAAGFSSTSGPTVRERGSRGVTAVLFLDAEGCHFAAHSFPDRELLLLDVLVPSDRDPEKVIEVFVRKLGAKDVKRGRIARG